MVKNCKIVNMFRSDLRKKRVCSKSATKMLYRNKFLVSIFKWGKYFQMRFSLWKLQVTRDWLCVRDIAEISLNRLLLFLILKSHRSCSAEKGVLIDFTKKHFCWSLFLIKLQLRACITGAFHWNLQNFWKHLFLKSNCIFV